MNSVKLLRVRIPTVADVTEKLKCGDEADRKKTAYGTQADLKCSARCEKDAVPAALAVEEKNSFRLYILEEGAFRREGGGWLNYISKRVEATGTVREEKGAARLKVDSLRLLSRDGK